MRRDGGSRVRQLGRQPGQEPAEDGCKGNEEGGDLRPEASEGHEHPEEAGDDQQYQERVGQVGAGQATAGRRSFDAAVKDSEEQSEGSPAEKREEGEKTS